MSSVDEHSSREKLLDALRDATGNVWTGDEAIEYLDVIDDGLGIMFAAVPGKCDLSFVVGRHKDTLSYYTINDRRTLVALKNIVQAALERTE